MLAYEPSVSSRKMEAKNVHDAISAYYDYKADALYEDTIIDLVGEHGLLLLREFHLIETCAMFNGRKLYAI